MSENQVNSRKDGLSANFEDQVNSCLKDFLEPAAKLFAVQKVESDKVREQTKSACGRMIEAHVLLAGVIGSALLRVAGKIIETTRKSDELNSLFASFVIGLECCESAIEQGRYLQAYALLRQEMETAAQLTSIELGKRIEGKPANVKVLDKSLARLYSDLSSGAHVSKHHVVRNATEWDMREMGLPADTGGFRYFPAFDMGLARRCFALHLILMLKVIEHMSIDYSERHSEEDRFSAQDANAVNLAVSLLHAEGLIELDAS